MTTSLPATALLPSPVPARRAAGDRLLAVVGALFVPGRAAAAGATPALPARLQARAELRLDGRPGDRIADLPLAD